MRCLVRNKQKFYYALYQGEQQITDSDGNLTGQYAISYGDITEYNGNISPANGYVNFEMFGGTKDYTHIICCEKDCPIKENSALWVEIPTTEPHNYIVRAVSKSLNSVNLAIRRVDVNN